MAQLNRDGVTLELPESTVPVVQGWLNKADSALDNYRRDMAMKKLKVNDTEYEVPGAVYDMWMQRQKDSDKAKKDAEDAAAAVQEKDKLQGKVDALEEELKQLKSQRTDAAALQGRRKLERQALPYLQSTNRDFKEDAFDTLSDRAIKELVISARLPKFDAAALKERNDAAIDAMFEVATAEPVQRADSSAPLADMINNLQRQDGADPIEKARWDAAEETSKAHEWIYK